MRGFGHDPRGRMASRLLVFAAVSSLTVVVAASFLLGSVFISPPGSVSGQKTRRAKTTTERPLTIAIVRTPGGPAEWRTYARAIKTMSDATGQPMRVRYVQDRSEIANLVETQKVDAGFLCTNCYLALADRPGVTLLVAPRVAGETKDAAVLVVRATSPYASLSELAGHRVGVMDSTSLAGNAYLYWLAEQEHMDVARSLNVVRGANEESNLKALLVGDVEAVVVNRSQLALWNQSDLRIISESPEFGMPPFVTGPSVDADTQAAMKKALLDMRPTATQPHSVVEGFSEVTAEDYAFARELSAFSAGFPGQR